jgi:hypothetical protein
VSLKRDIIGRMRVLFRNRRGGGSEKIWNALSTLMLEAMGLARVKAGRVCGFSLLCGGRVSFVGVLGSSFVGFYFYFFGGPCVYSCVRRGTLPFLMIFANLPI